MNSVKQCRVTIYYRIFPSCLFFKTYLAFSPTIIESTSIRHLTANLDLDGGAPIVQAQEMMRNSKIETTMVYVKQWNRVKKAAEYHIKQV
jgi:hypothetical protein